MINGCLLLVAVMALVATLAGKFAMLPPFHVLIATVAVMFALVLARSPDTRWQVEALAAVGGPALASAAYGYLARPEPDVLSGTSALLYVAGTAGYVLLCVVRGARGRSEGLESTEEESA